MLDRRVFRLHEGLDLLGGYRPPLPEFLGDVDVGCIVLFQHFIDAGGAQEPFILFSNPITILVHVIHIDGATVVIASPDVAFNQVFWSRNSGEEPFQSLGIGAVPVVWAGPIGLDDEALTPQVQILDDETPPCPDIPAGLWNRIAVKDSGEGIPAEILPHIFEPFFTTKPVGEGTGLGLAQAYGIIKQHDGYIDAHSELGKGTVFHIYLPAQQPVYEQVDHPELPAEAKGSGETLLLVEDDFSTREAMKTLLEDLGYQVLMASNGQEALGIYESKESQIDLVVSDIVMPLMGGVTLFQKLTERWPDAKMLFITGHPEKEGDQALLESGNVNWLQKPFSVGVFNEAIWNLLHD